MTVWTRDCRLEIKAGKKSVQEKKRSSEEQSIVALRPSAQWASGLGLHLGSWAGVAGCCMTWVRASYNRQR